MLPVDTKIGEKCERKPYQTMLHKPSYANYNLFFINHIPFITCLPVHFMHEILWKNAQSSINMTTQLKIDKVMLETWLFHNLIRLQNFQIYRKIAKVCKNVWTNNFNNRVIYIIFWGIEGYNIVIIILISSQIQNIPISISISIYDTVFDIF